MPSTCCNTFTAKASENHIGIIIRSQPKIVNGIIGVAQENGAWVYLAPGDVINIECVSAATEKA